MADPSILTGASSTDRSVGFFNDIFGIGWQDAISGTTPTGDFGNVIINMFSAFNAIVLAGVMVLMFYVISAGIVGTAHEGESLGKRYSTLWTPIRGALSVSFLMPLPWVKLSMLQAIILKFVFFSISGASYLATLTVDQIVKNGGAITMTQANLQQGNGTAAAILENLVVQEYFKAQQQIDYNSPGYTVVSASDSGSKNIEFTSPNFSLVAQLVSDRMGEIVAACNPTNPGGCEREAAAVVALIGSLRPIAVELGAEYTGDGSSVDQMRATFNAAVSAYATTSQHNASIGLEALGEQNNALLTTMINGIKNNGWAWLGTYYIYMSKANNDAHYITETRSGPGRALDMSGVGLYASKEYVAVITRTQAFISAAKVGQNIQDAHSGMPDDDFGAMTLVKDIILDGIVSSIPFVSETSQSGAAKLVSRTLSTGDPVLNIQYLGNSIINFGSTMMTGAAAAGLISLIPAGQVLKKVESLGAPLAESSDAGSKSGIGAAVGAMLAPLIIATMAAGVAMAYYLPAVPFIIWTSAVVGWLILTMELMVAAPIWAAMHAIPEGEGMAGQHGRQGYILFLGILVRPSLHVIGFFMAFAISSTVAHFVGDSYLSFVNNSLNGNNPTGAPAQVISWLMTLIIGLSLSITLVHKSFTLVTWLPDNLLRWAGGNAPSLGEHQDEGKSHGLVLAGAANIKSTGASAASGLTGSIKQTANDNAKAAEKAERDKHAHEQGNKK